MAKLDLDQLYTEMDEGRLDNMLQTLRERRAKRGQEGKPPPEEVLDKAEAEQIVRDLGLVRSISTS